MAVVVSLLALFAVDIAAGLSENTAETTFGHVLTLGLLIYALARWGTWRNTAIGIAFALSVAILGEAMSVAPNWEQQTSDLLTWGMFGATGIALRYRAALQQLRSEQIRSDERVRIARDLHDVVAHHVSAIAVQAEGAKAIARSDPQRALMSFDTIHDTAKTTLNEMRQMVAILRDDTASGELSPSASVRELPSILEDANDGLVLNVRFEGDVDSIPAPTTAALLRIAQEAVTNARRHAFHAQSIEVWVKRDEQNVQLTVTDDGAPVAGTNPSGYGILGMTERSTLLGGALTAEPLTDRGWQVQAIIPNGELSP